MDPVVSRRSFERFAGVHWSIHLRLLLTVVFGRLDGHLSLQALPLALSIGLLLVRDLGRLNEVMVGMADWTEDAFIGLVGQR
jgi:hypothetical protein